MSCSDVEMNKPWYRQRWPWLLMLGPSVVIIGGVITAWLAIKSADDLVADDYYQEGLTVNKMLQRDQLAALRQYQAIATFADDNRHLNLVLSGSGSLPNKLIVELIHPSRAGKDQVVVLQPTRSGFYEGEIVTPQPGQWHVVVEDEQKNWRLLGKWHFPRDRIIMFGERRGITTPKTDGLENGR